VRKQSGRRLKLKSGPNEEVAPLTLLVDSLKDRLNSASVCLSWSWGGLEKVAVQDAMDLSSLGFKTRFLCIRESPVYQALVGSKNPMEVIPVDFAPKNYFDFKMRRVIHQLVDDGTNLIHTHQTSILGSISPWLMNRPRVSLVATRHIMNNHNKKDFFHRAIYRRLDALIVMSETLRRNVLETHAIREKKVKVIHLGLDFNVFDPVHVQGQTQRNKWGISSNTTLIGLVGRIDPAKGQATFIKSAAGLLKSAKLNENLKFIIIGEETLGASGQYLEELKQMIAQFRIGDSILFSGYQDNVPEIMKALDIFVMPSRQEAFGLVAIEAMSMECPIIISRGGSAEEIVGQEEFGLLVRPEDAFDLQQKIRYLLDYPEERTKMARRARQNVLAQYDKNKRIAKTLSLYERSLRLHRIV